MNTVTKENPLYLEYLDIIKEMVSDLPNDKLKNNYTYDRLQVDEWIAISLFDGGFSSISWRPIWKNNCRILNRFYKIPSYRFENLKGRVSKETLDAITQQLKVASDLEFDCAFMSRETKTQAFHHYKRFLSQEWHTPKERYKMWNTGYQHIMWTSLSGNKLDMEKEDVCN